MKLEFYDHLGGDQIEKLWKQGIDMDDWDYLLFVPAAYHTEFVKDGDGNIEPECFQLSRLLVGGCRNTWYEGKLYNKKGFIGVAYHA